MNNFSSLPKCVRLSQDRLSYKLYDDNGNLADAVIIPTIQYPLSNNNFKVFTFENTCELKDEDAIKIIDGIERRIGFCYTNAENVVNAFANTNYNAKYYVGWYFVGNEYPVHHAWAVLNDVYLIDLTNNSGWFFSNLDKFENKSIDECRALLLDLELFLKDKPNSVYCNPLGMSIGGNRLYIGCESNADEGKMIFNKLIRDFPNHPCRKGSKTSPDISPLQEMLIKRGIMKI